MQGSRAFGEARSMGSLLFLSVFRPLLGAILLMLTCLSADAAITKVVTKAKGLDSIASEIKASVTRTSHIVQFAEYENVGNFRLDGPAPNVDSLIFERYPKSHGMEAVNAKDVLLDIKNYSGTVVLRGLAFNLTTLNSVLLSGYDVGRANAHLVIDSCFIFGENISNSFLTWFGGAGSRVEIRRSFLVSRTGTATASKVLLNASNVTLTNNLLNFPGQVSAIVLSGGKFDCISNSINRTQFRLNSEVFERASYLFNRNFIGHPGTQDAFGGSGFHVLYATSFDPLDSDVRNTLMYKGWTGFDHPANVAMFGPDTATNKLREPAGGKPATELWNWYLPKADSNYGLASGNGARVPAYNIFPIDSVKDTTIEYNPARIQFKSALFPRQFLYTRLPVTIPADFRKDLRIHTPTKGALYFGPFQVTNISLSTVNTQGPPVLIAVDTAYRFSPQRETGSYAASPFPFPNDSLSARYFYLSFRGNTPRGDSVLPEKSSSLLRAGDTLVFFNVDSAGYTVVREEPRSGYPDSLRTLGRSLKVTTSATVAGSMVYGSTSQAAPLDTAHVYWWKPADNSLSKAKRTAQGIYHVTSPASADFTAFLVEHLNVKRGVTTEFPLARNGQVIAKSVGGFQLRIDTTYRVDSLRYGQATRGHLLKFPGRADADSVILRLPGGQDMQAFKVVTDSTGETILPVANAVADSGFFRFPVARAESTVKFFTAIRFNVMAGQTFMGNLPGAAVQNLLSTASGLIGIDGFMDSLLSRTGGDTLPSSARFLGGKAMRTRFLKNVQPFSVRFEIIKPNDQTQVEAYAWDKSIWRRLPTVAFTPGDSINATVGGIFAGDSAFVVLERRRPATEYVAMTPVVSDRKITITTSYTGGVHGPIDSVILQVRSVDQFGEVSLEEDKKAIGQVAEQDLSARSGYFEYRVIFRTTTEGDYNKTQPFVRVTSFDWIRSKVSVGKVDKEKKQFHLIGFPYSTSLAASLQKLEKPTDAKDSKTFYRLVNNDSGKAAWDTLKQPDGAKFATGEAVMFNAAAVHNHLVDPSATFLPADPFRINPAGTPGWRFISPPFPMTFSVSAVQSTHARGPFLKLNVEPKGPDTRQYSWLPDTVVQAFKGYAYYFQDGEVLTFDPWHARVSATMAKPAASQVASLDVVVQAEGIRQSMRLLSGPGARNVPFLPAPGAGVEMRVGGGGGYMWKRVESLAGIDEAAVFRTSAPTPARLDLIRSDAARAADWHARLINLATGEVVDPAAQEVMLPSGSSEFRLVAGREDFVNERVRRFRAGIPADLILSQNYPNPFRSLTRITLDWPAADGAVVGTGARRSYLDIFDARGRRVQRMDLGLARVGRQWVTVDASRWEPGIYSYRLTVVSSSGTARLQKRMLVAP